MGEDSDRHASDRGRGLTILGVQSGVFVASCLSSWQRIDAKKVKKMKEADTMSEAIKH